VNRFAARIRQAMLRVGVFSDLAWRGLPNHLYVFNYHRIGNVNECEFDPNVFSCDAEHFEAHIQLIKQRFRVLDLEELASIVAAPGVIREPLALLTFDDGYIDGYTDVLPILQQHDVSGVFFVTTQFVGSRLVPWWDRVAWWVRRASRQSIVVDSLGLKLTLGDKLDPESDIRVILAALKRDPSALEKNLGVIRDALCPVEDVPEDAQLFMDWKHLQALVDAGMSVGSHTLSHRMLATLNDEDLKTELEESRSTLSEQLACPITALAYPVGTRTSFDERSVRAAKDAGYEMAFSFIERANELPLRNPHCISRIGIGGNPSARDFPTEVLLKLSQ
jgi:peptidoglycan/xylan/chitin deacetylase (PgdA/CDA1 family)